MFEAFKRAFNTARRQPQIIVAQLEVLQAQTELIARLSKLMQFISLDSDGLAEVVEAISAQMPVVNAAAKRLDALFDLENETRTTDA